MATPDGVKAGGKEIDRSNETKPKSALTRLAQGIKIALTGDAPDEWFGPSTPMETVAPQEQKGRQWDYPFAVNRPPIPRTEQGETNIDFTTLRRLADPTQGGLDLLRLAIETRKDQLASSAWRIQTRGGATDGGPRARAIESALRMPDAVNPYRTWQRMLLEDLLVIDAPAVYVHKTKAKPSLPPADDPNAPPKMLGPDGKPLQPQVGPDGKPVIGPDGKPVMQGAQGATGAMGAKPNPFAKPGEEQDPEAEGEGFVPSADDEEEGAGSYAADGQGGPEGAQDDGEASSEGETDAFGRPKKKPAPGFGGAEKLAKADPPPRKRPPKPPPRDTSNDDPEAPWQGEDPAAPNYDARLDPTTEYYDPDLAAEVAAFTASTAEDPKRPRPDPKADTGRNEDNQNRDASGARSQQNGAARATDKDNQGAGDHQRQNGTTAARDRFADRPKEQPTQTIQGRRHDGKEGDDAQGHKNGAKNGASGAQGFAGSRDSGKDQGARNGASAREPARNGAQDTGGDKKPGAFGARDAQGRDNAQGSQDTRGDTSQDKPEGEAGGRAAGGADAAGARGDGRAPPGGDDRAGSDGAQASGTNGTGGPPPGASGADEAPKPGSPGAMGVGAAPPPKLALDTVDDIGVRLQAIDGATVKRIVDIGGRTPAPPDPAYLQVIKGMPAFEYTTKELIYAARNLRTNRIYGMSPVEQVVTTVNIALKRQLSQLEYYTAGTVPDLLIGVPETWTPQQLADFQEWWDLLLTGNTADRRKARFVPGGMNPFPLKDPKVKDEWDEWLSRIICFAFSLSPQALIKEMNRATAESNKESAAEQGLEPLKLWWKDVMDAVLAVAFDSPMLEFVFEDEEVTDPATKVTVWTGLVGAKIAMPNEARDAYGLPPIEGLDEQALAPPSPAMPLGPGEGGPDAAGGDPNAPGRPPFGKKPNPFDPKAVEGAQKWEVKQGSPAPPGGWKGKPGFPGGPPKKPNPFANKLDVARNALALGMTPHEYNINVSAADHTALAKALADPAYRQRVIDVLKGSPDQPRDEKGRFAPLNWQHEEGSQFSSAETPHGRYSMMHSAYADEHGERQAQIVYYPKNGESTILGRGLESRSASLRMAEEHNQSMSTTGKPPQEPEVDHAKDYEQTQAARKARTLDEHQAAADHYSSKANRAQRTGDTPRQIVYLQLAQAHLKAAAAHASGAPWAKERSAEARRLSQATRRMNVGDKLPTHKGASLDAGEEGTVAKGDRKSRPSLRPLPRVGEGGAQEKKLIRLFKAYLRRCQAGALAALKVRKVTYGKPDRADLEAIENMIPKDAAEEMRKHVQAMLEEVAQAAGAAAVDQVLVEIDDPDAYTAALTQANEAAQTWAEDYAGQLITGINQTTLDSVRAEVAQAIEDGSPVDELRDALVNSAGFGSARAEMIARTELAFANVTGNIEGWKQSGVVEGKKWIVSQDKVCDDCEMMEGVTVPLDEPFVMPDGDEVDGPPAHPSCRCDVVGVVFKEFEEPPSPEDMAAAEAEEQADEEPEEP